jgi:16S rRNA (guanine527-N7)-methyltransferase
VATTASIPAPPALAATVFGDRLPLAEAYARWLAGAGVERGLVGPREADRIWDRHILNCVGVGNLLSEGAVVADLGSGAGLPGLAVAIARPDVRIVAIESMLRRCRFLEEVVADLGLTSVTVCRARAEDVDVKADAVIARAVAPIDRLAGWARRLLRDDGVLLALKGTSARAEVEAAWPMLETLGFTSEVELLAITPTAHERGAIDTSGTPTFAIDVPSLPGLAVVRLGSWAGAASESSFTPDAEVADDDRVALVVRLQCFPQARSRRARSGLG